MNIKNKTVLKSFFLMLALFLSPDATAMTAVQRAAGRSCAAISRSAPRIAAARTQWASAPGQQRVGARAFGSFSRQPLVKSPRVNSQPRRSYFDMPPIKSYPESAKGELLLSVVQSRDKERLRDLIRRGMIDLNTRYGNDGADGHGTILHIAVIDEIDPDIIRMLIDAGAKIDAKDILDETPLHRAASLGNVKVVKMLVDKGANPNEIGGSANYYQGQGSPLHFAQRELFYMPKYAEHRKHGVEAVIRYLEPLTEKSLWFVATPEDQLRRAIQDRNLSLLKDLLFERKQDQKVINKLFSEIYYGSEEAVDILSMLIDAGADVNTGSSLGTPLHEAAYYGNKAAVELLLAKQANPNAVTTLGETALDAARRFYGSYGSPVEGSEIIRILEAVTGKDTEVPAFSSESDLD